jgi:hypothetical protein
VTVASFAFYRKVAEDQESVSYEFGPEKDDMTRTLAFDKATGQASLGGPYDNPMSRGTALSIYRRFRNDGAWPETGVHAS